MQNNHTIKQSNIHFICSGSFPDSSSLSNYPLWDWDTINIYQSFLSQLCGQRYLEATIAVLGGRVGGGGHEFALSLVRDIQGCETLEARVIFGVQDGPSSFFFWRAHCTI